MTLLGSVQTTSLLVVLIYVVANSLPSHKIEHFAGTLFDLTCSAEVNSACAKVLLRKTLVTPDSRRKIRL